MGNDERSENQTFEALRLLWTVAYLAWKASPGFDDSLCLGCRESRPYEDGPFGDVISAFGTLV